MTVITIIKIIHVFYILHANTCRVQMKYARAYCKDSSGAAYSYTYK